MNDAPNEAGSFAFTLRKSCPHTRARLGSLRTPHGSTSTPAFMPVGTAASIKGVEPRRIRDTGSRIVLCNTYHLVLRPGDDVVRDLGGLHAFMRWDGPILTDSGGYQVFSLAELTETDRDGVTFRSHIDGRTLRLTPERAMEIQLNLGSDVMMAFDECLPAHADREETARSLEERTLPWARRCLDLHPGDGRALFAVAQGGLHEDLRRACVRALAAEPFDGLALGGLSVGESKEEMRAMVSASTAEMPAEKPRYLMGVGSPLEILDAVALGVDLFDCVLPTRNGRNGAALTFEGVLRLKNARHTRDAAVIERDCPCAACSGGFSRAYLRHLLQSREMLGATLMSIHNLTFMQRLMAGIREALETNTFESFRQRLAAKLAGETSIPATRNTST